MINVIFLVSIILFTLSFLGAPILVRLIASGFKGEQFNLTVKLTRIGLPMLLFSGIIGVFTGYLQSEGKFNATAMIGIPFNFIYIIFLLLLSSYFGIKGLMVAGVLATMSQLLIQIPEAKATGYKYKAIVDLKDPYILRTLKLSLPVMVGVAINDLNTIIDKNIASSLVEGSISPKMLHLICFCRHELLLCFYSHNYLLQA